MRPKAELVIQYLYCCSSSTALTLISTWEMTILKRILISLVLDTLSSKNLQLSELCHNSYKHKDRTNHIQTKANSLRVPALGDVVDSENSQLIVCRVKPDKRTTLVKKIYLTLQERRAEVSLGGLATLSHESIIEWLCERWRISLLHLIQCHIHSLGSPLDSITVNVFSYRCQIIEGQWRRCCAAISTRDAKSPPVYVQHDFNPTSNQSSLVITKPRLKVVLLRRGGGVCYDTTSPFSTSMEHVLFQFMQLLLNPERGRVWAGAVSGWSIKVLLIYMLDQSRVSLNCQSRPFSPFLQHQITNHNQT